MSIVQQNFKNHDWLKVETKLKQKKLKVSFITNYWQLWNSRSYSQHMLKMLSFGS